MEQSVEDPVLLLPIDITYTKLADWLVDRRKIPADWRKKLASLRSRVTSALSALPRGVDPWLSTLTPECTGYLEAKHIRDVVVQATPEARTLFGQLSGSAGEWDGIVRSYEKEQLHLGEAAQLMVQHTNYEIPYQKKQIAKLQQQLTDMERKEAEFRRNAAASAIKYQHACQELGILGNDVREELKALGKSLPTVFLEVVRAVCDSSVGEALELYQTFVSYAHTGLAAESGLVLAILRGLRDHPPVGYESNEEATPVEAEGFSSTLEQATGVQRGNAPINWDVEQDALPEKAAGFEIDSTGIDWNTEQVADVGTGGFGDGNGDIDWDIEQIEKAGESSAGIDWEIGSLEPADLKISPASDFIVLPQTAIEVDVNLQVGEEINWDIDVDDGIDALQQLPAQTDKHLPSEVDPGVGQQMGALSCFLQKEYRNSLLDDLSELKAFLKQRVEEMGRQETVALQNQVQAVAPAACVQHGSDALLLMAIHVTVALDTLTSRKTRDLSLLVTSSRFLDRLDGSLLQKKETEMKLVASSRDLSQKQIELRNMLSLLWTKQEVAMMRAREAKKHTERTISSLYNGRPVNIIGEINSILGQT